VRSVAQACDRT